MTMLVLGLLLWSVAHLFPVVSPRQRAGLTGKLGIGLSKGAMAIVIVASVVLMVIGYQRADYIDVWTPPVFLWHVNNVLMLLAVFIYVAGGMKSIVRRVIRHPQLTGTKVWALAHLLVNGDLASIVLFGGLLAWAVVTVIFTNRRDGPRGVKPDATGLGLVIHVAAAAVITGAIMAVHTYAGVRPFPG